jgi:hypothetical protein
MPDPFRHYEGVPVLDLPGDPLAPELLSLFGYQVEMTVHLIIVEGADAGRTQAKCLGGEGTPLRTGRHSSPVPIRTLRPEPVDAEL